MNFLKRALFATLFSLFALCIGYGQINEVSIKTNTPKQYSKVDIDVYLTSTWNNPYLEEDVALDMKIITPTKQELILPCYYESGQSGSNSLWKARFAPQETGGYTYSMELRKGGEVVAKSERKSFKVKRSNNKGFLHVKNNWILQYDNGEAFRGIGENIGWESRTNDDSKYFKELHENHKYNYNYMLGSLAKSGGNFYRTWICTWNLPLDWKDNFNNHRYTPSDKYYNPSAIKKIDSLVELSENLNLYMMLTLGAGAYSVRDGGFAESTADFFVNPESKKKYKNRLRYIIARWGYSTSIGAWELFNEIDNIQYRNKDNPIPTEDIVAWHDEMSRYIKETDPYKHIVTTSISHIDLEGLNSISSIDINQKHIYNDTDIIPQTIIDYENEFNKPYVIGEFGYEWDWSKNFDDFADGMDLDFKRGLWYGLFNPTPILPLSWWWEYFDDRNMTSYIQSVRTINDRMLDSGNGDFKPLVIDSGVLESYAVQCGNDIYVYLFNQSDVSQTGEIVLELDNISNTKVQSYNPENLKFKNMGNHRVQNNQFDLNEIAFHPKEQKVFIIHIKN